MSAREEILGRVRSALASADRSETPVPRGYRSSVPSGDVVELFAERLVDYRAELTRCTPDTLPEALASALGPSEAVLVPDGFPWAVPGAVPDTGQSAAELDRLDAVVTLAALAIATTGTIVLDHGPGQGRRAVSLVPDRHVCVLRTDQIVPGVPQAVAALSPGHPQTWISGPSATSDIELNRVEGVHGPRTLHVLLVSS
ncbi:LutC/YkgG family protein [Amycolatopsis thermophila]|uniref:L-lactate dehydrogenase complex protein LldG n=1 Tax=Amycolatopsis thermophila TaxID=206084 RepID=A0ABU0ELD7_9PSEU|nr:lactate utilization protein C [Amycolatopsis thermophila]MDQ0376094.1 L-lactate dehydrogenase complex protein LldG [Amycolatopsis thermophila]